MQRELQKGDIVKFQPNFMEHDPRSWGQYVKLEREYVVEENDGSVSANISIDLGAHTFGWFNPEQLILLGQEEQTQEGWTL